MASIARPSGARMSVVRSVVAVQTAPPQTKIQQIDIELLNKKLEAKAKALIALEEQEIAARPKVVISIQREVALGESWKVVGRIPELGRFVPEVAPHMKWGAGHVWTYEGRIRPGQWEYKLVLRKPDGAIVWEEGPDRKLEVPEGKGPNDVVEIKITDIKLPA
eukprot:CAMPEP_0202865632 /NCGR_PEP_ID=MMETSP1391-20130828/6270_1 /ASSEMBLY_ACC=CAM_ASM_000867 /TAXON_ID=1034604 /ORGANISM="Chlamydomonas leiostraca, Strain SAG 11-49" /LENGTH=162 /DNA_ID=CAMNT_0049545495 /DNA_START=128 /DNA_END=616 /DNA_ORIENTATION=-